MNSSSSSRTIEEFCCHLTFKRALMSSCLLQWKFCIDKSRWMWNSGTTPTGIPIRKAVLQFCKGGIQNGHWTIYSATTILEKCRKVVLEMWFCKLGFFFLVNHFSPTWKKLDLWYKSTFILVNQISRTRFLEPDFSNQISQTRFLKPDF